MSKQILISEIAGAVQDVHSTASTYCAKIRLAGAGVSEDTTFPDLKDPRLRIWSAILLEAQSQLASIVRVTGVGG